MPVAGAARIDANATAQEARGVRAATIAVAALTFMPLCWRLAATAYGKVCEGSGYERPRRLRRYAALLATFFVLTVVGVPGQLSAQTVEDTDTRPNILVFVSDDMGWGQPGFNGGTEVETPNMDRLADEGVKLTQFYVQPVCAPTRASLLTGRYAWKTGMAVNPDSRKDDGLLLDERTIAEALRESSYATWLVGKWHAGYWGSERLPLQRGFDHHYGFYDGFIDSYKLVRPWRGWHEILDWHRNGRPVVESGYSTFLLAEEASQLIERHDGSRPFFLYVAFNAPHDPYQAPPEYIAQFSHLPYDLETRKQRAMVKAMDDAIGQVMDALERRGVLDETLVMFLNDNGGESEAGGNSPYRGLKRSYLEGGIRVPAVMRWPSRITAGSASDALMHVADLFPTFAGLAGADTGGGLPLDGLDVWEAIANGAESPREEVVHSLDVIRVGDWKLLEEDGEFANGKSSPLQLYNIAEDPYETTNLASSETARVAALRERLVYHRPFARDAEPGAPIPGLDSIDSTDDRPVMFGEEENTAFGTAIQTALTQREAGNLGPALLRLEASGTSLKLIYNETLDAASVPHADAFTVVVNPGYRAAEVVGVELSGSEVVLTLAEAVADGNTVGLTYEVLDTGAIQDTDSLEAVGITWVTATVSITDDDFTVSFEQASYFVAEGDSVAIKVSLSAGQQDSLTIPLTTTNQDGASNSDYSDVPNPTIIAGTVVAADHDSGDEVAYTITGGGDASEFEIGETTGVLTFARPPNYESPADVASMDPLNDAENNEHIVTVTATGGTADRALTAEQTITVTVRNVEEAGTVSFSQVGAAIRAKLSDPDGGVNGASWQWARSLDRSTGWVNISSATSAVYTPSSDDQEKYLRATVSYDDGHGSGKQAQGVSTYEITPPKLLVSTLVSGLTIPWDLAFTPDGTMLFTERSGVLSSRLTDGTVQTVTAEFGDVFSSGENGLMGIVVDPDFSSNRRFYTCQAHTGPEIQVIAWTINAAYTTTTRVADPLVGGMPASSFRHGGCRLRFGPQGYLWIATGDAASGTVPQDLTSLGGKVLRVDASTGAGAPANPFASSPLIYTYGHRNPQGLALRPGTSQMWSVEHGPSVDDEINLLVAGRNYGWDPLPGYNESVSMTDLMKFPGAVEAKWSSGSPTLATSGGIFLEGDQWGVWEGRLALATLQDSKLRLFEFTPEGAFVSQVVVPELNGAFGRLRTPMMGPDGALYVTTSNGGGVDRILRIVKDEAVPVTLKLTPEAIGENGGVSTVTVSLERESNVVTTVTVSATAVSPAVSGDFSLSSNKTLTIGVGQSASTGTVTITANNNGVDAPNKTVMVTGTATNSEGLTGPSDVTLTIRDDDATPVITTAALILVAENETVVATLLATDEDDRTEDLVWDITGGVDQSEFTLTTGGELAFKAAKDYENPDDSDGDRDYAVRVRVSDGANPVEADFVVRLQDVDDTAPTVSKLEITSDPGTDRTYAAENEIRVTVTFSETVVVTRTPRMRLRVGSRNRTAGYLRGSGAAALVFSYEVALGDEDTDGVSIAAGRIDRNGGTIKDEADNDAVLDHEAVAPQAGHKVDGVRPAFLSAAVNAAALTLTYGEALDEGSRPAPGDFTVQVDGSGRSVSGVSVSGRVVTLTLASVVAHDETVTVSYSPGANPIRDVPGNDAEALSRKAVTNETPDTTSPTVSSVEIPSTPPDNRDTYAIGDVIEATVTFDETVVVTRTPRMRLRVGSRNRTAGYLRGSGAAALVFSYEVALGDEDTDGVSIAAGRIDRNGGTIKDEADNDAVLDHEAVAPQAGHKVDGVRPAFLSAAVDGSSLTLTYGETLDGGSRPAPGDFTVQVDGAGRSVAEIFMSDTVVTLILNPAVEHGDTGIRVSYTPGTNPLRDAVGNDAVGLSSQSVTNTTGAPNTAPEITTPSSFEVPENQALARRLVARDTDPGDEVTGWEIVGGVDQGQFTITSDTGELSFRTAPDFEAPGDNEYEVTVEVRSGTGARELEAEQTFTVRVTDEREPPGVPDAPTFSGETADSLRVSWREPDNTGPPITDYDVQYREGGSGGFTDAQHEGLGLALTLSDLKAGTVYQVQVRATNEEGTGDWSEPGEGRTIAPLRVQMTPSPPPPVEGAFSLRFSFSEEVRGFTSGDIETQQEPACTDSANNPISCNPTIAALQTTDNRIFTTTVTPRTERVAHNYTLTITVPADRVTSSPDNKPNEATTLDVRIAPPGVTVPISSLGRTASPGNGQVTLRWNAPQNTGGSAIIRYEYRWRESGGEFGAWVSVGPAERAVTVHNLTNGREYMFEVRGVNALGYGPVETASATPESGGGGFPPPPRPPANNRPMADAGPDQTGVREGALVTLDGSGSSDPDDDPLKYRWNQYRGERVALSSRDVVNPTFTAPRELTADAVLSFRLLVTDPGGRFDTDTVEVTVTVTDENPGKPLAPTVSAATPYGLMVEWMEPENTGPAIIDYDVQYRKGDSGDGFTDAQHQGTARTATLTGLMPDTVYEVQVRATNTTGTGDWSESGEGKTKTLQTGDQIYYFPHLAVGASWQTTITYINYSREEVTCQTDFLSDHGTPLMVSFAELGTVDSRTDVLPPGGSVHQETDVDLSAPLAPGWALANCSGPLKASLLYRQHNSEGVPTAEAGANATAVPATRFVTFAEQGEGQFGTGVAYANPSATAALVTFTARDAVGEVLASVDRELSPGGHDAHGMAELFGLSSFTGSIEVTSTEPIVSLSLNFEADSVFSSLPPGELDAPAQGSTTYYFPHLAVGASWQTTITYINYSPDEVTCQTDFISDHGTPLMVSFAALGTVVSRTDVLPPGGSVHQETNVDLNASLAPGWARATCSGPVKASLLYRLHNSEGAPTAEAGVNATAVPATRFVTFAEQGEGQFGTGVAYANPSAISVPVTFTARDAVGEVLASVVRTLSPGGHDAHGMAELFGLTSFTGSIEVTSTEPIVSLSLNFEAAPVFSSLPPGELDASAQ